MSVISVNHTAHTPDPTPAENVPEVPIDPMEIAERAGTVNSMNYAVNSASRREFSE